MVCNGKTSSRGKTQEVYPLASDVVELNKHLQSPASSLVRLWSIKPGVTKPFRRDKLTAALPVINGMIGGQCISNMYTLPSRSVTLTRFSHAM